MAFYLISVLKEACGVSDLSRLIVTIWCPTKYIMIVNAGMVKIVGGIKKESASLNTRNQIEGLEIVDMEEIVEEVTVDFSIDRRIFSGKA